MNMALRILLVGGGSGGHLAPLAAVAEQLKQLAPGCHLHAVCTDNGSDLRFLQSQGLTATEFPVPKKSLLFLLHYRGSKKRALKILEDWKPDIVFSKGGSISIPLCNAAHQKKIPIVIHESDAVMGRANAIVSRWADVVCCGFKTQDTRHKCTITGNPIRSAITQGNRTEGLRITGLTGKKPILLVTGGSQGATALNNAIIKNADELLEMCDIIHITGEGKKGLEPRTGYWSCPFAFDQLPHLYACTSLALSRAGAGSIGELAACRIPAILVPIRGLAHDHQYRNALAARASGGCLLIDQKNIDKVLTSTVAECVGRPAGLKAMATKIHLLHHPDAARRIAKIVVDCVDENGKAH